MNVRVRRGSPSYLIRNPYSYCFRLNVPKDLQSVVCKKELRYSLKTGYLHDAKFKARLLAGQVQQLFRRLREDNGLKELSDERIRLMVEDYLKRSVEMIEERWLEEELDPLAPRTREEFYSYVSDLDSIKEDRIVDLGTGNYGRVETVVDELLEKNDILDLDKSSPAYLKLCREVLKAQIKELEIEKKQMLGEYDFSGDDIGDVNTVSTLAEKMSETSAVLSKIAEDYWNEKEGGWKERTKVEWRKCLDHLVDFLGRDTQIHTVDYQRMREYKESLMAENSRGKTLSPKTVNKYLGCAKGLFTYAIRNNHIKFNPADGLSIQIKDRADEERDTFDVEDLNKLFNAKEYVEDKHTHPHNFWLPVLGLYTGCRLEELCQLYIEDVKEEDGVWVIDVNEDKPDKSVKAYQKRLVPLHPFLVDDLNFIGYVQSLADQKGRVFPKLKRINHRYGHNPGQWFNRFKGRCGIDATPQKKTFHSFRHTVINHLYQNGVNEKRIMELVGHRNRSMTTGRYGKRFEPKKLLEETILNLDYGIDLTHLKKSKYVIG